MSTSLAAAPAPAVADSAPAPEAATPDQKADSSGQGGGGGASAPASKNPGVQAVLDGNKADKAPDEAPKKETPAEKRYRLAGKVDGKEEVWEGTEAEMLARLQKASAADKRMAEAAEIKKRDAARKEALKKDPNNVWKVMQEELGVENFEELAERRLLEKYKLEEMNEEQRAQHDLQTKLAKFEAEAKERQEAEAKRQEEETVNRIWQQTEKDFTNALQKTGLTGSMEMLREMAEIATLNHNYQLELTPDQMAAEVKDREDQRQKQFQTRFTQKAGEDLLGSMGDEWTEKVRQALLARARGKSATTARQPPQPVAAKSDEKKPMTRDEWRKWLRT